MSDIESASNFSAATNRSVSSAIVLTRARKAALLAKKKEAVKRAELEQRRTQLNLEIERHELDAEIAAAEAEEAELKAGQTLPIEHLGQDLFITINPESHAGDCQADPTPAASFESPSNAAPDRISSPPPNASLSDSLVKIAELSANASLPKVEILPFNGDPKNFVAFMTNFHLAIECKIKEDSVRLNYLIQFCLGDARKLIEHCVVLGDRGYSTAVQLLQERYGSPYVVARTYIDSLTQGPSIKANDTDSLVSFSDELMKCGTVLNSLGYLSDLNCSYTMRTLVSRLPTAIRSKWAEVAHRLQASGKEPDFSDFCSFVKDRAAVASSMYGKQISGNSFQRSIDSGACKSHKNVFVTKDSPECSLLVSEHKPLSCSLCTKEHFLSECLEFKSKSYKERVEFIKHKRLCFNCLRYGHVSKACKKQSQCPKCKTKHHVLVHREQVDSSEIRIPESKASSSVNCANRSHQRVCLRILPVVVKGHNNTVETYALLDEGSNVTLCTESLLNRLDLHGPKTSFRMTTVTDTITSESFVTPLTVSSLDRKGSVCIDEVLSVKELPVSLDSMIDCDNVSKYSHLEGLALPKIDSSQVDLLIGGDVPEVFFVEEQRCGGKKEPYAVKSVLGWSLLGPVLTNSESRLKQVHFQKVDLSEQVERMWKTDFNDSVFDNKAGMSVEDRHALKIFEDSATHDGNRYHISLPWRDENSKLQNNISMALHRLQSLKRRLLNDSDLYQGYCKTINQYISKGHAERVGTIDEVGDEKESWFLPHHAVVSPKKPGKVRVVFDCAAKCKNTSLNDVLLQGPDLVNSLIGVLMRFRSGRFAFIGDIESMFHQVAVTEKDRKYFRFLWWNNGNLSEQPDVYRMNVHIFGATSSPSACSFALRKTAQDFAEGFSSEAVSTVLQNFYVDDCLKSVDDIEEGIRLVSELRSLLLKGGFNLTKFYSNSIELLNSISNTDKLPSAVDVEIKDELPSHNTLGMTWNIKDDSFSFSVRKTEIPVTRRGVLSVASSLFDPLGLLAPVALIPKLLLQELCREGLKWDDIVPDISRQKMEKWIQSLSSLENFHVSRCLKPIELDSKFTCELHHFCDASESAYGVASYVRIFDEAGNSKCTLVAGKSRLAPLKKVTVPRLELSAAVVAVRLHQTITREMNFEFHNSFFWTDSEAVLRYINNKSSRFKTFVANRLAVIHDITEPSQWKYVPSSVNPADLASRGIFPDESAKLNRWCYGPEFLGSKSGLLPDQPNMIDVPDQDCEEVKATKKTTFAVECNVDFIMRLVHSSSSFEHLQRSFVWLSRFKSYCIQKYLHRGEVRSSHISVAEMQQAKKDILSIVQQTAFPEESKRLASDQELPKGSRLRSLCPILIDGVICVGGRLQNSKLPYKSIHPVILPPGHHVTDLLIRQCHENNGHVGPQQVLTYLRESFWILKGLSAVKRVTARCFPCRRNNLNPVPQKMGNLPVERVVDGKPPFTYVGVDYFGPIYVRCKRTMYKRYGCLFTCMTCRAVHIEVSHSLTTDSFLCSLRRFCARRGQPEIIVSDNGKYFVGADRELQQCLQSLNQTKIHNAMLSQGIEWRFTTPSSPHEGGIWERLVRSVKAILRVIVGKQVMDDEALLTFLAEVERILNDRPLTSLSSDVRDPEVLTPSSLLLLKSNTCCPPFELSENESSLKKRWKQGQFLANLFWKRWIREYLPLLQQRKRWQKSQRNFKVNDLVLVKDENQPRGQWPLGIIVSVSEGEDGLVRRAEVRCGNTTKMRHASKLCLLEGSE